METPFTHILLINSYDVAALKYRDNKEDLFKRFIDSVMVTAEKVIRERTNASTEVIRGLTHLTETGDSSLANLVQKHHATHAIVINFFNVLFEQTEVEVTKTNTGKDREAFYDIISEIRFSFYENDKLFKEMLSKKREAHSSRSVISGLLAAGPNVVVQRKDAWNITRDNLYNYLNLFF